jgi:lysyl-tRNA synthetase class 1
MASGPQSVAKAPLSSDLWPREEAARLAERIRDYAPGRPVIFESGFGPSGLPHLGTMCEVLRPAYVRQALRAIDPDRPSRLIVFIDDMDGLRKVPENVPRREETQRYLGVPVSRIPDPFGCCASFADHMIGLLGEFLAPVEVDYELMRSSEMYRGGAFDEGLRRILEHHRDIIRIVTPTLREENRAGWSPVMPVCPNCGQINSTLVTAYHVERATVEFSCERRFGGAHPCGKRGEQSVLGGNAKAQWKVDWALRWFALGVDYELYGKDLTDSARLSGQILRILGGQPPLGFPFEMFLDDEGHKVSKSIGRGVTVAQWLRYAPIEVLKFFLLTNPRRARKLFLGTIPQYVDEYLDALREYAAAGDGARANSPLVFVLQKNSPRRFNSQLSFAMMMNLVSALGSPDRDFIWKYITRYDAAIAGDPETEAMGRLLIECALNFYNDFVEPTKQPFVPNDAERGQLREVAQWLRDHDGAEAEEIEKAIYDFGRRFYDKPGRIFTPLYRAILSQERGPRLGAFIRLATPSRIVDLLEAAIARRAA